MRSTPVVGIFSFFFCFISYFQALTFWFRHNKNHTRMIYDTLKVVANFFFFYCYWLVVKYRLIASRLKMSLNFVVWPPRSQNLGCLRHFLSMILLTYWSSHWKIGQERNRNKNSLKLVLRNNLSNRFVTRWHHKTRHISFFCRNILYR